MRENKIDRALNGQAPADKSDDEWDAVPDVVKDDDERSKREVNECVQEAADLAFPAEHNEEADPDTWLHDVRQAGDEETERGQFFDGYLCDHAKKRSGDRTGCGLQ